MRGRSLPDSIRGVPLPGTPPIKMFDYLTELEQIHDDVLSAVDRVLRSGQLILGPEVERFERAVVEYLGGGHAVGVASGTDALIVAMLARGIGPGDEVITVANTAVATASAIQRVGATPVFCDVDPNTALLDLDKVGALVSERTRAIIPVHLYGNAVDVPQLLARLPRSDLFVLEDCAQAMGGRLAGRPIGTLGHAAAFSFYPTKNLGAYGDGGLCFTKDEALAETMRQVRRYGFSKRDYAGRPGVNSRLDELHAAILNVKLPRLDSAVATRRGLAQSYETGLPKHIRRLRTTTACEHARHLYVVHVPDREVVVKTLTASDIDSGVHYPYPLHSMPGFRGCRVPVDGLPHTERLCASVLSIPLHPALTPASISRVCSVLASSPRAAT
ncbi:MAG: DegT/DnrJ/EryC1/StrS family aminotransferase [Polyangiales bacterium]